MIGVFSLIPDERIALTTCFKTFFGPSTMGELQSLSAFPFREYAPGADFGCEGSVSLLHFDVGQAGNPDAGIITTAAIVEMQLDFVLLVGCAGGRASALRHFDLVIPNSIYFYELGKISPEGFRSYNRNVEPNPKLRNFAVGLATDDDWMERLPAEFKLFKGKPDVVFAPLAAGDKVITDTTQQVWLDILDHAPKTVAVEMESYGCLRSALEAGVPALTIRSISDLIDDKDRDAALDRGNKQVAAALAATFAAALVRRLNQPSGRPKGGSKTIGGLRRDVQALVARVSQVEQFTPKTVRLLLLGTGVPVTGPLADFGEIEAALRRHVAEYRALQGRVQELERLLAARASALPGLHAKLDVVASAVATGRLAEARGGIDELRAALRVAGASRAADITEADRLEAELMAVLAAVSRLEGGWEEAARLLELAAQTTDVATNSIRFRLESAATIIEAADNGLTRDLLEPAAERVGRAVLAAEKVNDQRLLAKGLFLRARIARLGARDRGPAANLEAIADLRRAGPIADRDLRRRIDRLLGDQLMRAFEGNPSFADLDEAEQALRSVIDDPETIPVDRADAYNTLGAVMFARARQALRDKDRAAALRHFRAAHREFRAAGAIWTLGEYPLDWTHAETNIALVHRNLAEFEDPDLNLRLAMESWRGILKVRLQRERPLLWAETMSNMGVTLRAIGERENGTDSLEAAIDAYKQALAERTAHEFRRSNAFTQENIANVQCIILGRRLDDPNPEWQTRLDDAKKAAWSAKAFFAELKMVANVASCDETLSKLDALQANRPSIRR